MPVHVGDNWPTVAHVVDLFCQMGCELHCMQPHIHGDNGPYTVRYLMNVETEGMVSIGAFADDDRVPISDIEYWERRLDVEIPKLPEWY